MRGFLQISPTGMDERKCYQGFILQGINNFHLLNLRDSEVKQWIRNGTIAKRLTWYFS